ncbi:MAG TPA: GNAT family N-acetyltransferase [Candidatus Dormibacteraeota bacterium]|nr:GNAT family N-acetyltransferase [Candidatus Dormibacteraeota bacterium]
MLRRALNRQPRTRQLWATDSSLVEACLEEHPLDTVFLRSEIRQGALRQGSLLGVEHPTGRRIRGVVMHGPLVVPWAPDSRDLEALARALRPHLPWIQLMVGPQDQVARLQELLGSRLPPVRTLRAGQPHYALDRGSVVPEFSDPPPLRRARTEELEQLVRAGAAMHLEEVGFDPLAVDPSGYRERVLALVRRGRLYVWMEGDRVAFKAECSSVTPEAVQLQGVWTDPTLRRQGRATRAMATLCHQLLADTEWVTLFVNDFNDTAIRVYERTGFKRIGTMRTVLF